MYSQRKRAMANINGDRFESVPIDVMEPLICGRNGEEDGRAGVGK
jgi:hypothetical protein